MDRKGFLGALAGLLVAPKLLAKKEVSVQNGFSHVYDPDKFTMGELTTFPAPSFNENNVRWVNADKNYRIGDIVQQSVHTMTVYI